VRDRVAFVGIAPSSSMEEEDVSRAPIVTEKRLVSCVMQ
jgi:hypothetical protein